MVIDARKAHLHAMTEREIYVDLPPELGRAGYCGRLRRCLYGTRDASARWEAFLAAELQKHGFVQGVASPCCFKHAKRDLRCVVHGDDFVFVGPDVDLEWARRPAAWGPTSCGTTPSWRRRGRHDPSPSSWLALPRI